MAGGREGGLQFVQEVVQGRDAFLQALALARFGHHLAGAAGVVEGIARQDLPVVEDTLGEGLAAGVGPQVGGEACGEERGSRARSGDDRHVEVTEASHPGRGGLNGNPTCRSHPGLALRPPARKGAVLAAPGPASAQPQDEPELRPQS